MKPRIKQGKTGNYMYNLWLINMGLEDTYDIVYGTQWHKRK